MSTWSDVRQWLDGKVGPGVYASVPESRPDEFVVVDKTGGEYAPPFDRPQLTFYAYSRSLAGAEALLDGVCALLDAHPADVAWNVSPTDGRDASVPLDPYDGSHYRFEITYQFAALC